MQQQAFLDEVFLSLQGEAGEAGRPHLFLRMGGCPLRCRYCDTPRSWTRRPSFERHESAISEIRPNPIGGAELHTELNKVAASHAVPASEVILAVTGGEPLEQADFLEDWLPTWIGPALLETAGLWPDRLERLLPLLDLVSLDWKLASTLREGGDQVRAAECAGMFGHSGVDGWVKIVVAVDTLQSELGAALELLSRKAPGVKAYLQPATPVPGGPAPPAASVLLDWVLAFRQLPLDLRVQPQMHPVLGAR